MIYNEWIKDKPSLFNAINVNQPSQFITLYGSDKIDLLYKLRYGNKTLPSSLINLTVDELGGIISIVCSDHWNRKYTLLRDEILLGVDSKEIVEESVNDDIIRISNSNSENKISAYNDDELTTNDTDSNIITDDTKKEGTRIITKTNVNMNAIVTQLEILNSNFLDDVLKDVSEIISLSIY